MGAAAIRSSCPLKITVYCMLMQFKVIIITALFVRQHLRMLNIKSRGKNLLDFDTWHCANLVSTDLTLYNFHTSGLVWKSFNGKTALQSNHGWMMNQKLGYISICNSDSADSSWSTFINQQHLWLFLIHWKINIYGYKVMAGSNSATFPST